MINTESIIQAFVKLGKELRSINNNNVSHQQNHIYDEVMQRASIENQWFTPEFVKLSLVNTGHALTDEKLKKWVKPYKSQIMANSNPKTVGVVMAGNVPLVGFHDFISVLLSGNRFFGKLSSDDRVLLPFVAERLLYYCPEILDLIKITEDKLSGFDAVIATGSNNTSRYFEYYFRKYPNIIRKNRNGVAVLTGEETGEELQRLGEDVFYYFGMGCRSISKIYVPQGYDFVSLLNAFEKYKFIRNTNKYNNNYDYYRSIFLLNKVHHYDNGFIMITMNDDIASAPSVLYYEEYKDVNQLNIRLMDQEDVIQCIVSQSGVIDHAISFGTAQKPELWDYADGVDTMAFLLGL